MLLISSEPALSNIKTTKFSYLAPAPTKILVTALPDWFRNFNS